jgi:cytochrome c-type biogenesis protein CcmH
MAALCALATLAGAGPAVAVQPDEVLKDAALEERARAISAGLRCLVCQNQSIDDSDAPLARDLRLLVRERLTAGDTDAEVEAYLVQRFGDFVLLRPPLKASTLLLWLLPAAVLLGAAALAWSLFARRTAQAATAPQPALSPEEERRLADILRNDAGTS